MADPTPAELWTTWHEAAQAGAVDRSIRALYADLDRAVRDAPDGPHGPPVCNASGRCCRFDTYGHRLYVTGLEIAWFLSRVSVEPQTTPDASQHLPLTVIASDPGMQDASSKTRGPAPDTRLPDACRYQVDGLCSTHTVRPLGCRVFFCTPGTDDWQHAVYERFLDRLRALHADHDLPYRYMEWRAGLAEADGCLRG
jgi:Fe-S-cluster containining protein